MKSMLFYRLALSKNKESSGVKETRMNDQPILSLTHCQIGRAHV
jgi:hypothetical protein